MIDTHKKEVLLVDDAADTGYTLASAKQQLQTLMPHCHIYTAVITVSQPRCIISPDFALYRNRTLIRFPWAADYND